jgi:hypothetical protein
VTGGWRKLHNEELHGLYSPPNKIRMIKSGGLDACHASRMVDMRNAYTILAGKPAGTRPIGGLRQLQ